MKPVAQAITCKDGTVLSVQASAFHYCSPRDDEGPYRTVEVGFIQRPAEEEGKFTPVRPPLSWKEYADGPFPSDVYGYVPIEMVQRFIKRHGGIEMGELPPAA